MSSKIQTYAELQKMIRKALREQRLQNDVAAFLMDLPVVPMFAKRLDDRARPDRSRGIFTRKGIHHARLR